MDAGEQQARGEPDGAPHGAAETARAATRGAAAASVDAGAPFGAHAPGALALALRAGAQALGPGRAGRIVRSLVARALGFRSGRPVDLAVFGGQRARLHPVGNLCEKRVAAGERWWEAEERAFLAAVAAAGSGPFTFFDVGANVGLYTLAARSAAAAAGRPLRAAAIEPQPAMLARLRFNLAASGAGPDEVLVLPWAAVAAAGEVRVHAPAGNFGGAALGPEGVAVPGRPLLDAVAAAGVDHIDAMKLDIEGHEAAALAPFLADAPRGLWPGAVILEAALGGPPPPGLRLLLDHGYQVEGRTRMNALLRAPAGAGPAPQAGDRR